MEVDWDGRSLTFSYERYPNDRIAVLIKDGFMRYGRLSTNIPEVEIEPDQFLVAPWNLPDGLLSLILATGLFQDTGVRVFGGVRSEEAEGPEAQVWRIVNPPAQD